LVGNYGGPGRRVCTGYIHDYPVEKQPKNGKGKRRGVTIGVHKFWKEKKDLYVREGPRVLCHEGYKWAKLGPNPEGGGVTAPVVKGWVEVVSSRVIRVRGYGMAQTWTVRVQLKEEFRT